MSSYLSNLLTQTTSRYNSFRRTLLSSEDDGDTEDDTHVCRVLRAYYTEKGRSFPQWLPPDPNDRRAITPQPYANQSSSGYFTSAGGKSQYSGGQGPGTSAQRGSLSDLWDAPRASNAQAQPQSLRNARRPPPGGAGGAAGNVSASGGGGLAPPTGPRPLPSQRTGSYQSVTSQAAGMAPGPPTPGPGGSAGGGSAQDRLKARLWGGNRATSPVPGQSSGGRAPDQYDRQPSNAYDASGGGNRRHGR